MDEGKILIVTGISGSGKTTLVNHLLEKYRCFRKVITHTTRPARIGEVDGRDYRFITEEDFQGKATQGYFFEKAKVYNYNYGSSHKDVSALLAQGVHTLFQIDVQGTMGLFSRSTKALAIAVLTKDLSIAEQRLRVRNEKEEIIQKRLADALEEMETIRKNHPAVFKYLLLNDQLESAQRELDEILRKEGYL